VSNQPSTHPKEFTVMNLLKEFPSLLHLHGNWLAKQKAQAETLRFEGLDNGLPKGALVEVSGAAGSGKTEVALRFLAQNPAQRVAWVEEEFSVYPSAFPQNRVGLERVLFVDSPAGQALWTVHQMLRSGVFGVIVLRVGAGRGGIDDMALRRLQLAAEKSQVTILLLNDQPSKRGTWPIAVQLQAGRSIDRGAILLNVLKYRGQKSWQLSME
jgi:hypothetical protein